MNEALRARPGPAGAGGVRMRGARAPSPCPSERRRPGTQRPRFRPARGWSGPFLTTTTPPPPPRRDAAALGQVLIPQEARAGQSGRTLSHGRQPGPPPPRPRGRARGRGPRAAGVHPACCPPFPPESREAPSPSARRRLPRPTREPSTGPPCMRRPEPEPRRSQVGTHLSAGAARGRRQQPRYPRAAEAAAAGLSGQAAAMLLVEKLRRTRGGSWAALALPLTHNAPPRRAWPRPPPPTSHSTGWKPRQTAGVADACAKRRREPNRDKNS